jgi:mono/diheme cytochrome c family protein
MASGQDDDLRAIAAYVASFTGKQQRQPATTAADGSGEALYHGACASCHEGGRGPPFSGIELALSSALHAPDPTNLADVVVGGIPASGEQRAPTMPGFGAVLSDQQITDLLTYLRARFGGLPAWDDVPAAVQAARDTIAQGEAAP